MDRQNAFSHSFVNQTTRSNLDREIAAPHTDRRTFEEKYLHPIAADYLLGIGCSYEHEVNLYDTVTGQRGRIDFIAYNPNGSVILIDCKTSNHNFSGTLEQIRRYRDFYMAQYGLNRRISPVMMLIIPSSYWTAFHCDWAKSQNVDLVGVAFAMLDTACMSSEGL